MGHSLLIQRHWMAVTPMQSMMGKTTSFGDAFIYAMNMKGVISHPSKKEVKAIRSSILISRPIHFGRREMHISNFPDSPEAGTESGHPTSSFSER
jgi:hypothetical protein